MPRYCGCGGELHEIEPGVIVCLTCCTQQKPQAKYYHWTPRENVPNILKEGLKPSGFGIVYLSSNQGDWATLHDNGVCLEVNPGELRLTAFEDCREWEILCWGHIPPENIKEITDK